MTNHEMLVTIAFYAAIFGVFCSTSFILFLIATRKSRKVEGFGFSLGQNCVIDILFAVSCIISRFDCISKNGHMVYAVTFLDYEISPIIFKNLTMFMFFTVHLIFYVLGIPFLIRYLKICKKINLCWKKILVMYFLIIIYEIIVIYLMNSSFVPFPPELEEVRMRPQYLPNKEGRFWNFTAARIVSY